MIKRPFFAITKPKLRCSRLWALPKETLVEIPLPKKVALLVKGPFPKVGELMIRVGDRVRTGQKIRLAADRADYFISSVTGTVSNISPHAGYMGASLTSIQINADDQDHWDEAFGPLAQEPGVQTVMDHLASLPGAPDFGSLLSRKPALETLVVLGTDGDLLVTKNQFVVDTEAEALTQGMEILRRISGIPKIVLLLPDYLKSRSGKDRGGSEKDRPPLPRHPPQDDHEKPFRKAGACG